MVYGCDIVFYAYFAHIFVIANIVKQSRRYMAEIASFLAMTKIVDNDYDNCSPESL
jgi:hypothetical protein